MAVIAWILFGLVLGLVVRGVAPEEQHLRPLSTALVGVAGGLVGGLGASALEGTSGLSFQIAGFVGSLVGALILLTIEGVVTGRRHRTPA